MRSTSRCHGFRRGAAFSRKIEDVLLRQAEQGATLVAGQLLRAMRAAGDGAPQIVIDALALLLAILLALFFHMEVEGTLARIAVYALRHQRMGGVEQALHLRMAVALLAIGDIGLGEGDNPECLLDRSIAGTGNYA